MVLEFSRPNALHFSSVEARSQVVEAIAVAVERGLRVPIVYNTSSYDALSSLGLMEGLVDIYMPDFKFWTAATSERLCKARKKERETCVELRFYAVQCLLSIPSLKKARDYPERARDAIKEMHRQVGDLVLDANGIAKV